MNTFVRLVLSPFLLILLLIFNVFGQPEKVVLEVGKPIERELKGGEFHSYKLPLSLGQFLVVVANQRGIDLVLTLIASDDKKLAEIDSPNGKSGPERLMFVTETAGDYHLEVRSLEKSVPAGRYEIKITELRASTSKDPALITATKLFDEGFELEMQIGERPPQERNAVAQKALAKFEAALRLFRIAENPSGESSTLNEIGILQFGLGNRLLAIDTLKQGLVINEKLGDKVNAGVILSNLGILYGSSTLDKSRKKPV